MKKKIMLIVTLLVAVFAFTGCSMALGMDTRINKKGAGTFTLSVGYSKDFMDAMDEYLKSEGETASAYDGMKKLKIGGKTYYGEKAKISFSKAADLEKILTSYTEYNKKVKSENMQLTESLFDLAYAAGDSFVGYPSKTAFGSLSDTEKYDSLSTGEDVEPMDVYVDFSITFDKKVTSTNGKLSKDKKTVTWNAKQLSSGKKIYAYTTASKSAAQVNVKNGKTYKKSVTIKVNKGKGTMYLDGVRIASGKKVTKVGSHTLVIVNQNSKRKTIKFKVAK